VVLTDTDQSEGQSDVQLAGIAALGNQGIGGEARRMLKVGSQPGPKPPPGQYFSVVRAGVVVGTDGSCGGDVGLTQEGRGNEKRVVMVLLMGREDQVVQNLTAGDR
jgi:hypothetical protein